MRSPSKYIFKFSFIVLVFLACAACIANPESLAPKGHLVAAHGKLTEAGLKDLKKLNQEIPVLRQSGKDPEKLTLCLQNRAALELVLPGEKQVDLAKQDMDEATKNLSALNPKFVQQDSSSYTFDALPAKPTSFTPWDLLKTLKHIAEAYEKVGQPFKADKAYQKTITFVEEWNKSHPSLAIKNPQLANTYTDYANFLAKTGNKQKSQKYSAKALKISKQER